METKIFLQMGLDRNLVICPSGAQIDLVQENSLYVVNHQCCGRDNAGSKHAA
jgi:hypothetical protein